MDKSIWLHKIFLPPTPCNKRGLWWFLGWFFKKNGNPGMRFFLNRIFENPCPHYGLFMCRFSILQKGLRHGFWKIKPEEKLSQEKIFYHNQSKTRNWNSKPNHYFKIFQPPSERLPDWSFRLGSSGRNSLPPNQQARFVRTPARLGHSSGVHPGGKNALVYRWVLIL